MALRFSLRAVRASLASFSRNWFDNGMQLPKHTFSQPLSHVQPPGASSFSTDATQEDAGKSPRIFAEYTLYKPSSAMTVKPGNPTFKPLESPQINGVALKKEGCVFMSFAQAIGPRQYDWTQKQIFALSVSELGTLIGLQPEEGCAFYHDPKLGTSEAGNIMKSLKVEPMKDRLGYFFNLTVINSLENVRERFTVPVTRSEFMVLRSAFNFIVPYLMGWHALVIRPSNLEVFAPAGNGLKVQGSSIEGDPDLEWAK